MWCRCSFLLPVDIESEKCRCFVVFNIGERFCVCNESSGRGAVHKNLCYSPSCYSLCIDITQALNTRSESVYLTQPLWGPGHSAVISGVRWCRVACLPVHQPTRLPPRCANSGVCSCPAKLLIGTLPRSGLSAHANICYTPAPHNPTITPCKRRAGCRTKSVASEGRAPGPPQLLSCAGLVAAPGGLLSSTPA